MDYPELSEMYLCMQRYSCVQNPALCWVSVSAAHMVDNRCRDFRNLQLPLSFFDGLLLIVFERILMIKHVNPQHVTNGWLSLVPPCLDGEV